MAIKVTTVGRLMIDDKLPDEYKGKYLNADKKGTTAFLKELAEKNPEKYVDVLKDITDVARDVITEKGGETSISIKDMELTPELQLLKKQFRDKINKICQDPKLDHKEKNELIIATLRKDADGLGGKLAEDLSKVNNSFALTVKTGVKGSPGQLSQFLFGDILNSDHMGNPIPIPGLKSYSEGVSPAEYWAGSYGSRAGYACLEENTLIRMADYSVKPIKDIQVGDKVLGSDKSGKTFSSTVTATFDNGMRECFEYVFRGGRMRSHLVTLRATPDHEVLSIHKEGKKKTKRLMPKKDALRNISNTFSIVPAQGCSEHTKVVNTDMAYLLGLYLGDGCYSDVTVTTDDTSLIDTLNTKLQNQNIVLTYINRNRKSGMPSYEYRIKNLTQARERSFRIWLRELGLEDKKSYDKFIPEEVFAWNTEAIAALASGLFESDGCATKGSNVSTLPTVSWGMTSEKLLEQFKELLKTRLGIYTTYLIKTEPDKKKSSVSYGYTITASKPTYTLRISNRDNVKRFKDHLIVYGRKAKHFMDLFSEYKESPKNDSFCFSYVDKTNIGVKHVYDFTVDNEDHLYVLASGAVVSNSVQMATAQGGWMSKQMANTAINVRVMDNDCGAKDTGLITSGDDPDIIGGLLARDCGPLKAGHVITKKDLPVLADKKPVIRSLITCQLGEGVCQKCSGLRNNGKFPHIGDFIGVDSAKVVSEPVTQSGLCLGPDTLVRMFDGSVKKITDIQKEDVVLAYDVANKTSIPGRVVNTYANGRRKVRTYYFTREVDSELKELKVEATSNHKFYSMISPTSRKTRQIRRRWTKPRWGITTFNGFNKFPDPFRIHPVLWSLKRNDIETCSFKFRSSYYILETYDIEIDTEDHLFVLDNGLIVSNSVKHTGTSVSAEEKEIKGMDEIDQFLQVPERFVGKSVLSPEEGRVTKIVDAPQGGSYVFVNKTQLHSPIERKLMVKVGDVVEPGDMLTDGTPNPKEIANYKGLGEARKYVTEKFTQILSDNNAPTHRRNVETIAKGFLDKVQITDPDGIDDYTIGDVVPYNIIQRKWKSRDGAKLAKVNNSVKDHYLETPVLHYTIGTKLTPKVINTLVENGISDITVHKDPPGFEPYVTRMADISSKDADWKTRLAGSNIHKAFIESASRGATSKPHSTSPVPGLMDPSKF